MIAVENGNDVSVEKVLDKKELAKQRKAFLQRERREAEKLIYARENGIDLDAINREREEKKRKREKAIEAEAVRKRKHNDVRVESYDAVKRH
jgi:hypothetical protein